MQERQSSNAVLMVRPHRFASNPQTAASNAFQTSTPDADVDLQPRALAEFEALVGALRAAGVRVCEIQDTAEPHTPDAVFPNNWLSLHADGTLVLYPMEAPSRRLERRTDLVEHLENFGYVVTKTLNLAEAEAQACSLEGTGSLVLDRANRIAYACLSSRTDMGLVERFGRELGYRTCVFDAVDASDQPIYHTNVMMCVGTRFAVVCLDSISDPAQRADVETRLRDSGHEIVALDYEQLGQFAGNMLELRGHDDEPVIAMSGRAYKTLREDQRCALERHARLVAVPIDAIEDASGGSVRCMLAEIHAPRANRD